MGARSSPTEAGGASGEATNTVAAAYQPVILSQPCDPGFAPRSSSCRRCSPPARRRRPPRRATPPPASPELDTAGVSYALAAVPASIDACAVEMPVRVSATGIAWNRPGVVSCAFALELDAFIRDEVQPLALARFGQRVRQLRHFGTYACRRETGNGGRWSVHASGRAIDLAGFELADGTRITVERDWRGHGAKSRFLHALARRACGRFSVVLTPDSDRDHRTHIHLDEGPWRLCGA